MRREFYQVILLKVLFGCHDVSLPAIYGRFWLFKELASMTGNVSRSTAFTAIRRLLCIVIMM